MLNENTCIATRLISVGCEGHRPTRHWKKGNIMPRARKSDSMYSSAALKVRVFWFVTLVTERQFCGYIDTSVWIDCVIEYFSVFWSNKRRKHDIYGKLALILVDIVVYDWIHYQTTDYYSLLSTAVESRPRLDTANWYTRLRLMYTFRLQSLDFVLRLTLLTELTVLFFQKIKDIGVPLFLDDSS